MPSGGPKDSLPPELINTAPNYRALNFDGDEVRLTFSEYIIHDEVAEKLVISPPLEKRPTIRVKSKTLIIAFNEELKDSLTYSMDFKNSIVDNNERNPYPNLRFTFSTGDIIDSLRMAGMVMNAFNLEPVENGLVALYSNLHDSAVFKLVPDYISKTDEKGIFMFDNIAPGKYHIFSINDANSNLIYDEGAEEIAFIDSIIIPSVEYHEEIDSLIKGTDSLLVVEHIHFLPEPFYLRQFTEDLFEQYIVSFKRETKYKCNVLFAETVADTFSIKLVDSDRDDWYVFEPNTGMDTITFFIADTTLANQDTILIDMAYNQLDSNQTVYVHHDTLSFLFETKPVIVKSKRKRKEEEEEEIKIPQFDLKTNIKSSGFDLNGSIFITAPEPFSSFDETMVRLYLDEDTTGTPLDFTFQRDTLNWRSYNIQYIWEPDTKYRLEVDSAASTNIYGVTSKFLKKVFETQEEDYYGRVILELRNVDQEIIVQLLKNNEDEDVIRSKTVNKNGAVIFDYLGPEKYKIKFIYDLNGNGKWDTGSYQDHYSPEKVSYLQKVIKVRSNWDNKELVDCDIDETYPKILYDKELEEQKLKAEKEAREKAANPTQERNTNSGFGGSNRSTGSGSGIINRR